eukprot:8167849-Ditylum_brightwellii.AAC.1
MQTSEIHLSVKQSNNTMLRILFNMSILINHDPQIKYYNVHEPPHLTEEDEEDNKDQSVTQHDDDDSDYEDPDDTSQDQD